MIRARWGAIAGALLLAGCVEPVEDPPEPPGETVVEPEPDPLPEPPTPLTDAGARAWSLLFEAEQAADPAPEWPRAEERFPSADVGPWLRSRAWYVVDEDTGELITARNAEVSRPIASITKLATAMVWADAQVDDDVTLKLLQSDKEHLQITRSRLRVGGSYRVGDLFYSSLLASDNRAAVMLARSTGLPLEAFSAAMNRRMAALGLDSITLDDPTGLSEGNRATARDVARLLAVASRHPRVGPAMQVPEHRYRRQDRAVHVLAMSSNKLMRMPHWTIRGSKTGFTNAAGSCIVFRTEIAGRNLVVALLGARGVDTRYGDAGRLRAWMEAMAEKGPLPTVAAPSSGAETTESPG